MAVKHPDEIARAGTELAIQGALIQALMLYLRPYDQDCELIYHVPNGGYRGERRMAQIVGAQMTLAGVKKGVPDLHLPVPRKGFTSMYIEMKEPNGGALAKEQVMWLKDLTTRSGACCGIFDDWRTAFNFVSAYFNREMTEADFRSKFHHSVEGVSFAICDPSGHLGRFARIRHKKRK